MATSRLLVPAGTSTGCVALPPSAIVGRSLRALPSGPPVGTTVTGPHSLVTVHETGVPTPARTRSSPTVSGSTRTPCAAAGRRKGLVRNGEVRRDSTSISHTPGSGWKYERETGLQAATSETLV